MLPLASSRSKHRANEFLVLRVAHAQRDVLLKSQKRAPCWRYRWVRPRNAFSLRKTQIPPRPSPASVEYIVTMRDNCPCRRQFSGVWIEWCVAALRRGAPAGHLEPGIVSGLRMNSMLTIDGNEAVANVAYRVSEVIAIYPITPLRHGELSDKWAARAARTCGAVPPSSNCNRKAAPPALPRRVAGLARWAPPSRPRRPAVDDPQHVQDRRRADADRLPCRRPFRRRPRPVDFGDHSDVMATRGTGFASSLASVQEAQDMAAIASAATLAGRIPVLHFSMASAPRTKSPRSFDCRTRPCRPCSTSR